MTSPVVRLEPTTGATVASVDVSVVLNIHREARFVTRTVRSLCEAAAFAAYRGVRSELVVVFDRSDEATIAATRAVQLEGFADVSWVEADHGSLGPARNTGIAHSRGEFVWLADADDLVSYNCIEAMVAIARAHPRCVVFPEYLVAFGDAVWVARYFGDEVVDSADFLAGHPYISRVFVSRAAFSELRFQDLRLTRGFAYEDWHMNCELRARGYRFFVAPSTVFFYRQREGSLLRQANSISVRQIPHATLFAPDEFPDRIDRERMARDEARFKALRSAARGKTPRDSLMEDASAMSLVAAAAGIDPAASHFLAAPCPGWTNVFADQHVGHAFADAARVLGPARFTDVVLLPSLGAGGGERYIIDVLHSLSQLQPEFRALVLAGEPSESHAWLHRLPAASTFLDIANSFPDLEEGERDLLVLRLVLASAPNARLHIKSSAFGERFARKYLSCLEGLEPIYYRFSDAVLRLNGADFLMGWGFDFVSSHLPQLRYVISDHQRIIDLDRARIGVSAEKWHCLYAAHEVPVRTWGESQTRRLLWASRITPEKRPPLMAEIARQLSRVLPDVTVDVFGGSDPSSGYMELLGNCSNIRLRGPFSDFAELGATAYDAFIYTSFFDGLPNVVLEAMAAGLIVIAPNVGGVGEVVMDGVTGLLSESAPTDEDMAHEYVERIRRLYCMSAAERRALGEAARELVRERHSLEAHSRRVHEVFLSGTTA